MKTPDALSTALTNPVASTPVVVSSLASSVELELDATRLRATIVETDREVLEALVVLQPSQRRRFVESAWSSGLRAAMSAHRLAGESRLEDIGKDLVATFADRLESHQKRQQEGLAGLLARYFDPKEGSLPVRIEDFLRDGGDLARSMDKYLSDDGALAKTLARSFGEASPLMKRLSATDKEGVVQMFEAKLVASLAQQQSAFGSALDPSNASGALAKFFTQLKKELVAANDSRDKQIAVVTKALDVNDKTSAMSRFFSESQKTSRELLGSMNVADPASPLGAIKVTLTSMLEKHAKEQREALAVMDERQRKDSAALLDGLARFEERRRVEARTAIGGTSFEDAVMAAICDITRGAPIVVEQTGNQVGLRPSCKKGDIVVSYGAEHKHAGACVVVEAKHDSSYTVKRTLDEMESARANRDASVGLFVMAKSHAPTGFPRFQRYGADILIIWDDNDPDNDLILELALSLALFMAPLGRREAEGREDIASLRDLESRIEKELSRNERLNALAANLRRDADKVAEEVRKGEKALGLMLRSARQVLSALDVPALPGQGGGETLQLPGLERDVAAEE